MIAIRVAVHSLDSIPKLQAVHCQTLVSVNSAAQKISLEMQVAEGGDPSKTVIASEHMCVSDDMLRVMAVRSFAG